MVVILMKKIVEYKFNSNELDTLKAPLEEAGYKLRGHLGMTECTISNINSDSFSDCQKTSIMTYSGKGDGSAVLRVKESALANVIDGVLMPC